MSIVLSLAVGIITGIIFTLVKLPLPAPIALEGVLGIAGIYLGYTLCGIVAKGGV